MIRTESKTGVVWGQSAPRSSDRIPFGTLQRDSHDHAPRSTRPRWRLRQADHSPGRSAHGRDHRIRTGPGHQSEGGRPGPANVDHAQGSSLVRACRPGGVGPGWWPRRPASRTPASRTPESRTPGAGRAGCGGHFVFDSVMPESDPPIDSACVSRTDASNRRGGIAGLLHRTTPRHRSGRDQPFRHPGVDTVRRSILGLAVRSKSSPAPVAGGGASPLRLPGDRSRPARCPEADRGGTSGTTPSPSAFITHRSLFRSESSILDGVSS